MGFMDVLKRWGGTPAHEQDRAGVPRDAAAAPPPQSRRRVGAAGDRASLWTEDPETCERCGRRLLVGELPALMQRDQDQLLVCPICVMDLAAIGFRSARQAGQEDARKLQRDAA